MPSKVTVAVHVEIRNEETGQYSTLTDRVEIGGKLSFMDVANLMSLFHDLSIKLQCDYR